MKKSEFIKSHPRLTRSLKNFITTYEESMNKPEFSKLLVNLDNALKQARALIMSSPEGIERAQKLHSLVEKEIQSEKTIQVSCFKGCSACCHFEVEITNYEALLLTELAQNHPEIDLTQLKVQGARAVQDVEWKKGIQSIANKCVFLGKDNACSIYESRPVMCRRHSVTSPPENCATQNAEIGLRFFPRVDLLISAANEDPNLTIAPMAHFLSHSLVSNKL